jgi:hypothetical protein
VSSADTKEDLLYVMCRSSLCFILRILQAFKIYIVY